MLGIWVASFGGALHAPVTTYFQVEVGASTVSWQHLLASFMWSRSSFRSFGKFLVMQLPWALDEFDLHKICSCFPLSQAEIGNFGVIRTVGVLLVSPLYGWLLDRHSAYTPAASQFATEILHF